MTIDMTREITLEFVRVTEAAVDFGLHMDRPGPIGVYVYNAAGRELWRRRISEASAGQHVIRWSRGQSAPAGNGIYIVKMCASDRTAIGRLSAW